MLKVGAIGTLNVLDWFVESKSKKLLFSSSSETYAGTKKILGGKFPIPTPEKVPLSIDDPSNPRWSYGAGKLLGEVALHSYAHKYKIDFSIVRYHNVYGPRMGFEHVIPQFIGRILGEENPFRIYGGKETRAFCYVDDAVAATRLVMEKNSANGETVNIGRGEEIKITSLAKKLFSISGFNPKIKIMPSPQGSVSRRCPDISKLKSYGFSPKVGLDEGLEMTFNWYKKNSS